MIFMSCIVLLLALLRIPGVRSDDVCLMVALGVKMLLLLPSFVLLLLVRVT